MKCDRCDGDKDVELVEVVSGGDCAGQTLLMRAKLCEPCREELVIQWEGFLQDYKYWQRMMQYALSKLAEKSATPEPQVTKKGREDDRLL